MMPNETERLAVLESRLEGIEKVVLRLDSKLDAWNANYIPRQETNEMFKSRDLQIHEVKEAVTQIRTDFNQYKQDQAAESRSNKSLIPSWVTIVVMLLALGISIAGYLRGH